MENITIQQILDARDRRAERQSQLLREYGKPLICFTMNIAGPVKTSPIIEQGFRLGIKRLEQQLLRLRCQVLYKEEIFEKTGCESIYVIDAPAKVLKEMTVDIEEADELGRLFDLDVLDVDGRKLERFEERGCLICGAIGKGCARSRAHTVEELQKKTNEILSNALALHGQKRASELACRALLYEACTTPKPGLVDRVNNGSHKDMDLFSFLSSSAALQLYFAECVKLGQQSADLMPAETFKRLRRYGRLAEGEMLYVTGGVNTHKGAIFIMGLICGALGRLQQSSWSNACTVLNECAAMAKGITDELNENTMKTAGEKYFFAYNIRGIRGEAEDGFPSVCNAGLPTLKKALSEGNTLEEAGCKALIALMSVSEDTALLNRGGVEGWKRVKEWSLELLKDGVTKEKLEILDKKMISENLSPGGSADLLAVCYLMHFLSEE